MISLRENAIFSKIHVFCFEMKIDGNHEKTRTNRLKINVCFDVDFLRILEQKRTLCSAIGISQKIGLGHQTIVLLKNFGTLRESAGSALLNHNKYLLNQHCIAYPPSLSAPLLTDVEKVRGAPPWYKCVQMAFVLLLMILLYFIF